MRLPWQDGIDAIVLDRERGASALAFDALAVLETAVRQAPRDETGLAAVAETARRLRSARPSMPALANLVNLALHNAASSGGPADVLARAAAGAGAAKARATEARGGASREAAALLHGTVLTHSASETVTKALRAAVRARRVARVVVAEGRPGLEGRTVARALAGEGVEVVLVVDAALGLHAREADVAIVGADALLADGSVVNKVGTRLLALACARAGTPLHAAADRYKVTPAATLPLEEKPPGEVWPEAPDGVTVRNIYFDRTEAPLVAGYATDAGLLDAKGVAVLAREAEELAGWEAQFRRHLR